MGRTYAGIYNTGMLFHFSIPMLRFTICTVIIYITKNVFLTYFSKLICMKDINEYSLQLNCDVSGMLTHYPVYYSITSMYTPGHSLSS